MDWFWNWGGECFGYRDGESLFTYFGKEAWRFDGELAALIEPVECACDLQRRRLCRARGAV
jgi:hypothetical protein